MGDTVLSDLQRKPSAGLTVSVSTSSSSDVRSHTRFTETEFDPYLILDHVWSPIVWRDGIRRSENFERCELIALDFDQGMSLFEAKAVFDGFWHVIATTRNHRLSKNGVVSDRFRVILRAQRPIACASALAATLSVLKSMYPIDGSCKDAARLFFPCVDLVSVSEGLSWTVEEPIVSPPPRLELYPQGIIPPWLMRRIERGAPAGERSNTAYKIGCDLARCGVPEEQAMSVILTSPLKDYCDALRNGFRRARASR